MSNDTNMKRVLGRSGVEVSAMGLGCWAIGGPFWREGLPVGWGQVNDQESIKAIHLALDLGITFFDTADVYGTGHSEEVLGRALSNRRNDVVLATKFGQKYDEEKKQAVGTNHDSEYVRNACEASLKRLQTDHIDLYQLHIKDMAIDLAMPLLETLERLVEEGKIRFYGWSTDDAERAKVFASGEHCTAIQARINVLEDAPDLISVCEKNNLAIVNRSPLGMGLLTGKFTADSEIPQDDVRNRRPEFTEKRKEYLGRLEKVRQILTDQGRTLAQGALAWLWARSSQNIPIPGFKSLAQVEENAGALQLGPLSDEQMQKIVEILSNEGN